jgi:hypothetical protein
MWDALGQPERMGGGRYSSSEDQEEVPARSYSGQMVDEHRKQQDARRRQFEVR